MNLTAERSYDLLKDYLFKYLIFYIIEEGVKMIFHIMAINFLSSLIIVFCLIPHSNVYFKFYIIQAVILICVESGLSPLNFYRFLAFSDPAKIYYHSFITKHFEVHHFLSLNYLKFFPSNETQI